MGQEREVRRFYNYLENIMPSLKPYDFKDKEKCIGNRVAYMLSRTQSMFEWKNLPETIPQRSLELYLQTNGFAGIAKHNGELYAFFGGIGGTPDPYYMPTDFIVANPALNLYKTFKIDKDCVIIPNDSLYYGLMPMLKRYATLETEAELSLWISTINSRVISLVSSEDDIARESAEKYFADILDGKLGVIAERPFLEGIKVQPYGEKADTSITNLIELIQYTKASLFNELGLNANYNMKRESLNTSESQMNNDALLPFVDDMLRMRQEKAEKVNEMFGTNISVDFSSSWKQNVEEMEAELQALENPKESTQMDNEEKGEEDAEKPEEN